MSNHWPITTVPTEQVPPCHKGAEGWKKAQSLLARAVCPFITGQGEDVAHKGMPMGETNTQAHSCQATSDLHRWGCTKYHVFPVALIFQPCKTCVA